MVTEKINGTEYADLTDIPTVGDTFDTEITNIQDIETDDFFSDDTVTIVNTTTDFDGETEAGYSAINGWEIFLVAGLFVVLFGGFGFPNEYDFSAPTPDTDDDDGGDDIPFFATTNVSHYEEIRGEFQNFELKTNEGENVTEWKIQSDLDTTKKTFSMEYLLNFIGVGVDESGSRAYLQTFFQLVVEIDYGRSVVTKFLIHLKIVVEVGNASSNVESKIGFIEGNSLPGSDDSGLPATSFFFSVFSISMIALIVKRRR